jgi:uncharacterized protein (DUF433 family)
MKKSSVVHSDPDILGGTPVFVGTRVPVQAMIDYIEGGHSLNEFLDDFQSVTRETAIAALEQAKALLIADAQCCLTSAFHALCAKSFLAMTSRPLPRQAGPV